MKLHILTDNGIRAFQKYLDDFDQERYLDKRNEILNSPKFSKQISTTDCIDPAKLSSSKIEASKYIHDLLVNAEIDAPERNIGLWAWLALYYFEKICFRDKDSNFKLFNIHRWILEPDNFKTYYRHLLAGPWRIYNIYSSDIKAVNAILAGNITTPGELYEQLSSRQEIASNISIMEVASKLYYDETLKKLKKGSGSNTAGSPRRLAKIINQFSRTWDLYGMNSSQILDLLPNEFNKFRINQK